MQLLKTKYRLTIRLLSSQTGTPYKSLSIGVVKETFKNENRVAVTPDNVSKLLKKGWKGVRVEQNAGLAAGFRDDSYKAAGAVIQDRKSVYETSDIILKVRPPQGFFYLFTQTTNQL